MRPGAQGQIDAYADGWAAGTEGKRRSKRHEDWVSGWERGSAVRAVLRAMWLGAKLSTPLDRNVPGKLFKAGTSEAELVPAEICEELRTLKLIKGAAWSFATLTDLGLLLIGQPTVAEQRKAPQLVNGPDVRKTRVRK